MGLRTSFRAKGAVHGQLKLARLLEMSEDEFSASLQALERDPLFERLRAAGAVRVEPFEGARFGARRFGGWGLRTETDGLPDALDASSAPVKLMQKVGQERFEEFFLRAERMDDAARARACGITPAEAKVLRGFVDRLYVQQEFSSAPAPAAAPAAAPITVDFVLFPRIWPAIAPITAPPTTFWVSLDFGWLRTRSTLASATVPVTA